MRATGKCTWSLHCDTLSRIRSFFESSLREIAPSILRPVLHHIHLDPQSVLAHTKANQRSPHAAVPPRARTFAYAVKWLRIHTRSHPSTAYGLRSTPGGGTDSGCTSCRSRIPAPNRCRSRTSMNEISLYANCWPRQMRGPALKGRKMNGFGTRYFPTRSSRNRSGSNCCAVRQARSSASEGSHPYQRVNIPVGPQ